VKCKLELPYPFTIDHLFLKTVGEMSDRFEIDVYAYALMGNHYHLLLKTNRANLSKSMQWLGLTYTRRFNSESTIKEICFQGRFKSIIVQNDAYLMRLSCYIHRNPLRAGIVKRLADYCWSNDEIGILFGVTYSSVSHIVKTIRIRLKEEHNLKERFNRIYSQFKI